MTDTPARLELSDGRRQGNEGRDDTYDDLMDAIDNASDQTRRTVITYNGKPYAAVVTAEDLERLEALDQAVLSGEPPAPAPDALTRLAILLGGLYRDGGTGSWRGLPPKPEGMTIEQHIERWLRGA